GCRASRSGLARRLRSAPSSCAASCRTCCSPSLLRGSPEPPRPTPRCDPRRRPRKRPLLPRKSVALHGILAAVTTPFTADASAVDEAALTAQAEWLIGSGIHGLVPCGTTGEF